ncbi:MAG: radical SAM protein [Promethearchaeota archaeon]|nr:MAG: radical SAM protein [Candidatus Lokiarchaeota archaeon]
MIKMNNELIYVNEASRIPLFGIDFLGIIDRGTNIIEIKPLTICNLHCRYCFVSAGDYETNFLVDPDYLLKKLKQVLKIKASDDIEIHIAPYGESLLYNQLYYLLKQLWNIKNVKIISMQSNGLLLTNEIIEQLEKVNLTRINISLNTLNRELAEYFCDCAFYDMEKLKKNIYQLLISSVDVLLAPVWFPGKNDEDIEDIIKYVRDLRSEGFSENQIQLGIQKYLIYKTGRKLKKVRPKSWGYFYKQLTKLEKKYQIKLKLGPNDFGIQKRECFLTLNLEKGDKISAEIISKGRWNNECIGKISKNVGIKILLQKPLIFNPKLIGKRIEVEVIKANYKDNIITAKFPAF